MSSVSECRICRDDTGKLEQSCLCTTLVHAECLQEWIRHRSNARFPLLLAGSQKICEICKTPFNECIITPQSANEDAEPFITTLARRVCSGAGKWCEWVMSVEGCLLLFLFVLAFLGHVLFLVGMYGGGGEEYNLERLALGIVNAILTLSLLVLVQKIVSRWLREGEVLQAVANWDCEEGTSWKGVAQVLLGGVLSVIAAAEIFFVLRCVPLANWT